MKEQEEPEVGKKETDAALDAEAAAKEAALGKMLRRMHEIIDSDSEAQRNLEELDRLEDEMFRESGCEDDEGDDDDEGEWANRSPFDPAGGTIYSGDSDEPEAYL